MVLVNLFSILKKQMGVGDGGGRNNISQTMKLNRYLFLGREI